MQPYITVNCHCHDYLELACMRGYQLKIELHNKAPLTAQAVTLVTKADKTEWLIVKQVVKQNNSLNEIRLDQIIAITPIDTAADFKRITIAP
ncbi:transcriptional antiterminator [Shewanella sp. Choline-02u-19]|jgi:Rho-binding antiterminator|uniref:Rho-binding antiterminator n=1 Tax=unclassified Shewanella TaxID=196818 RepID=UPI000C33CD7A|nr:MULTISPECIES: Rho-binding antiterminator [unclassified Shewanella]PKG56763.1 transcriptional antiterminator [Shewanella sp. GutDb-MelDb]PKG75663.1 transcriptional antiterminator [Shewanella sp. GutCb]PKH60563.1 transcriptional antiterminator [Shewanella sp. Bg11-22]PKI30441.1 transcriptional antiterminator [Shewanella sp. Choline-02u-19]